LKRLFSIVLRLLISGMLLTLLFREHNLLAEISPRLGALAANWPWTLAGIGCAFMSLFLTALRWHILLRGMLPGLPLGVVLRAEVVSAFFNISSLGVVGGDAYKIMALSRRYPGQKMPVSVSLVLDHLTGLVAVAFLFFICVALMRERWETFGGEVRVLMAGYGMYLGGSMVGLALAWFSFKPELLAWGRRTFPRTFGNPKFTGFLDRTAQVHEVLGRLWRRAFSATLVAVLLHAAFFMSFYCGLRAVGGSSPVLDVLTAMPIVDTAASLPVSVSGLGVRERTFEALLSGLAGVPEAVGVSASLAGWLFNLFWGLVGGLLFLRAKKNREEEIS
jgi:uncharacterized membrane protein YbhN (UPF0104 family)